MKKNKWFRMVMVTCICLYGLSARAGVKCPKKPKNPAEAKKLAQTWWGFALKFYEAKLYSRAIRSWKCSYKMFSHPLGLMNIAMAAEKAKMYKTALEYYQKYLPSVTDGQQRRIIQGKIYLFQNKLGIRPRPAPRPAPTPAPRPPVVARPPVVTGPAVTTRPVQPGPPEPTPPTPVTRPTPPTPTPAIPTAPEPGQPEPKRKKKVRMMSILGWTAVGVGAALAVTGVALGVMADDARKTVTEAEEGTNWKDKLKKSYQDYDKYLTGSLVCAGIGAAALVGGAVMLILDRMGAKKEKEKVSAVPVVVPNGAVLSFEGRF